MIYVGIDVASQKYDCYIMNHNGKVPRDVFTVNNDQLDIKNSLKL